MRPQLSSLVVTDNWYLKKCACLRCQFARNHILFDIIPNTFVVLREMGANGNYLKIILLLRSVIAPEM